MTKNYMSLAIRARIDTDRIQPTDELKCTEACPSLLNDKCLVCSFSRTTVEYNAINEYAVTNECSPVFDEIHRQYQDHKARRRCGKEGPPAVRRVTEYTVVHSMLGLFFEGQVIALLTTGWQLQGMLQVHEGCGTQVLTRDHEIPLEEKDCDDHTFIPQGRRYVCEKCSRPGVGLSSDQQVQCSGQPIISVHDYVKTFLP